MKPRISMITLGVDDMKRAVKFYEEGLGFPRMKMDEDDVAFFTLNGTWLGLYGRKALAEDAQVPFDASGDGGDGRGFNSFALAHNLSSDEDVDEAFAHAVAAGAEPVKEPQKVFWGGYSGYIRDPDGHLWELAHNPFTWIGPED